jgi:hypothetical protein
MTLNIGYLLLLLAAVCFLIAALRVEIRGRVSLTPLGLFLWVLSQLLR